MAPTSTAVTGQLRQLVYYHIDNMSYDNALFFAERLAAHDPRSTESAYLLAVSHFRLGDYRSAHEVSKAAGYRGMHLGCAFIFAQTCLVLECYKEGIAALEKSRGLWAHKTSLTKHSASSRAPNPDTAGFACLLGRLYRAYDDKKKAIVCFEESLKANPFMWNAFTALCDMGVNVRTPNIFKTNESLLHDSDQRNGVLSEQRDSGMSNPMEPTLKKSSGRSALFETADPFDIQRSTSNDVLNGNTLLSTDTGENELMSKIHAARVRNAAHAGSGSDGMDTPLSNMTEAAHVSRVEYVSSDPSLGAPRKARNAHSVETSFVDAPLKMGSKLGTRRGNPRAQGKGHDEPLAATTNPTTLSMASSAGSGIERKRTVSGHPVQPRHLSEEPSAPRRMITRGMFRGTSTKANSGPATIGAGPTRELRKARPPVSRLMRPNSSGRNVVRAVSGNTRPPVEENGMDVDHAEAPRIKEMPPHPAVPKPLEPDSAKAEEALKYLLELLKKFGTGYFALSQFRCLDALAAYGSLPRAQQDTPWVLSQVGRAYYEQAAYAEAEKYYRRLRILAPTRLEDMEVYSTILWFLKRETDLSFLAHELVDSSWHSPQAWCALGNAWSLARDHEQALRCFKRATQLNPKFAYAFTLQGHEHVANEEYEKALTAYRQAISADRRHYNAYYGIGRVYEKLGNYDKAYTHFHSASVINPTNAVLICCIGNVLEKQRQPVQALQFFSKATELAPNAAQTRYKKARALLALDQLEAAQKELEILKNLAPDEATVHFLLGKLYKSLDDKGSAVRHFTIALNLDPKVRGCSHLPQLLLLMDVTGEPTSQGGDREP
jgi:anaphase-promoting complex subunit 3